MKKSEKKDRLFWLWLLGLQDVGAASMHLLLRNFDSVKSIFDADERDYKQIAGLKKKSIDALLSGKNLDQAKRASDYLIKHHIDLITWFDERYPDKLKEIYNPPAALFAKGNLTLLKQLVSIGIVGSRKASPAGIAQAKYFSQTLGDAGVTVISGLAKGVDAAAHEGAIHTAGSTIAVLGCGINICYPSENRTLYRSIIQNDGLILSEFFLGTSPQAFRFPMRNRIISGLSEGVLVVESARKSGALITVRHALEQGKNIYAIPKDITMTQGTGNNQLLKEGAKLVVSPKDILEDYVYIPEEMPIPKVVSVTDKIEISDDEKKLLKWISQGYDSVDRLEIVSGLDISILNGLLSMMELKEIISVNYGNIQLLKIVR